MATFAELLTQHRTHIHRVLQEVSRLHYLSRDEALEFGSVIDRALERNDYALLRGFEGRSTWETYLTTVIWREFFGFQSELWGSWRPSSDAIRLGPAATLLEELMTRDRLPFDEAVRVMRASHRVDLSRERLSQFYRDLHLDQPRPEPMGPELSPAEARKRAIEGAMADALAILSPDERLMLRLRYTDREPLTRIAKLLKDDPRPVQRRIEQARAVFRTALLTQGITAEEIDAILENAEAESRGKRKKWWHGVLSRPSND